MKVANVNNDHDHDHYCHQKQQEQKEKPWRQAKPRTPDCNSGNMCGLVYRKYNIPVRHEQSHNGGDNES